MPYDATRSLTSRYVRAAANGDDAAVITVKELVEEALTGLGPTPDHVAATLTTMQTRGHLADGLHNPVSRHLVAALGAATASVDHISVVCSFTLPGDDDELSVEDIDLPPAVGEFLKRFNTGDYAHLIDRTTARPIRTRYLRSVTRDTDGLTTRTRGTVVEVVDRGGTSHLIPDQLVQAIAAAGLTGEDLTHGQGGVNRLRLYDGDLCVALVQGADDVYYRIGDEVLCSDALWWGCSAYQYCSTGSSAHRAWRTRDEALAHVLDRLGETCRPADSAAD